MYILYKTTNIINGKYYIGVSNGNNKWYKGSGSALKRAIKKHGVENFKTEILETFDNETDAFTRESQVVTEELVNDRNCYNLKVGGKGGVGQQKTDTHRKNIALNRRGGRPPVDYSITMQVYNKHGLKEGAKVAGVTYETFKQRVLVAKKMHL